MPAAVGILASLDADMEGTAVLEVPSAADVRDVASPAGVDVVWLPRVDPHAVPGRLALERALALPAPSGPWYGWVVGESALATGVRRHWVKGGLPKQDVMFCGYWKH